MPSESPPKPARYGRIGKYDLQVHIATGGMGAVYKALDTELNRLVALKVLPPDKAQKPILLKRFRREALVGAKLRHENVVRLFEIGEEKGTYFLALEFIEGLDLHYYISKKKRLDVKQSQAFIVQAIKALDHLYQHGVVHRDVKPSNFLVTRNEENKEILKLIDLGLARETDDDEGRVTKDGTTLGTVDYMAPEQARDAGKADIRADIYSLGCTWYHMLTGKAPFPEGSLAERIIKHVDQAPPNVRDVNPDVPDEVIDILGRMLAKKPEHRYQTPAELLEAIENPKRVSKEVPADILSTLAEGETAPDRPAPKVYPGKKSKPGPRPAEVEKKPHIRSDTPKTRPASPTISDGNNVNLLFWVCVGAAAFIVLIAIFILFKKLS